MLLFLPLEQFLQLLVLLYQLNVPVTVQVVALWFPFLCIIGFRRPLSVADHLGELQRSVVFSQQVVLVGNHLDFDFFDIYVALQVTVLLSQRRDLLLHQGQRELLLLDPNPVTFIVVKQLIVFLLPICSVRLLLDIGRLVANRRLNLAEGRTHGLIRRVLGVKVPVVI